MSSQVVLYSLLAGRTTWQPISLSPALRRQSQKQTNGMGITTKHAWIRTHTVNAMNDLYLLPPVTAAGPW